jgi:hypothetical protein
MPVAFSPIEAYGGTRWYGLVLSPCDEPNHYRRIGRLEIQIPTADVTDILRNVDEGLQPRLVHPELYWLYMMQRMTSITSSSPNGEASHSPVDGREREIELV